MKTKEIAAKYGIDQIDFEVFLKRKDLLYFDSLFSGITVSDESVQDYVSMYKEEMRRLDEEKAKAQAEAKAKALAEAEEAKRKKKALSEMLISSGFSFDGYKIVKYSGYISGDDATQIPRSGVFGGNNGSNLTDALVRIRRQALKELKEAAYDLGCNAVVGVDFDYITLEPETANITGGTLYEPYIICVTANGNAVVIEKETE